MIKLPKHRQKQTLGLFLVAALVAGAVDYFGLDQPASNPNQLAKAQSYSVSNQNQSAKAQGQSVNAQNRPASDQDQSKNGQEQSISSDKTPKYSLQGRVGRIFDGDTFVLRDGEGQRYTIRVASIDAPETESPDRPGQPFGEKSKAELQKLIANKSLVLPCYEQDHYGRHVCDVPLPGKDITAGQHLVKLGLAWANEEKKGKFLRDESFRDLQAQAQKAGRGLWRKANPIEPWQWRYDCWQKKICDSEN